MSDLRNILSDSARYYREQEKRIVSRLALLPKGTVKEKSIGSRKYFYLSYRQGKKIIDKYLGAAYPEDLRRQLDERRKLLSQLKEVRAGLRLLRQPSALSSDFTGVILQVFSEFSKKGLWESGLEIIGSWCFLLFQKYLPLEPYPLRTQDLDLLIPLPYKGKAHDLPRLLKQLGFDEGIHPDGSSYFAGGGLRLEFVSPKTGRREASAAQLPSLKVTAQLLRYTDLLASETMTLTISQGVRVRLPSPAAFMLHKLIIASVWQRAEKQDKDLKQAISVARYVLQSPGQARQALALWTGLLAGWRKKAAASLRRARDHLPLEAGVVDSLGAALGLPSYPTKRR